MSDLADVLAWLEEQRSFLDATIEALDWRWEQRSVLEARRDAYADVLAMLATVTP